MVGADYELERFSRFSARLITAAPEMYRLLSSLLNRCVIIDDCAVDEIKQLIAIIDGEEAEHE